MTPSAAALCTTCGAPLRGSGRQLDRALRWLGLATATCSPCRARRPELDPAESDGLSGSSADVALDVSPALLVDLWARMATGDARLDREARRRAGRR